MSLEQKAVLMRELYDTECKHQQLNALIDLLSGGADVDPLSLRRMKKRRLLLKDRCTRLRSLLIPDLDA